MPPLPVPARFCPRCGAPTEVRLERPVCTASGCSFTWYPDPKVAVGVLAERGGLLLLVRRNHEPAYGRWAFPSGYVDAGEVVEDAALREVREETGVTVRLDRLLGVYSQPGSAVVFIAYAGTITDGEPVAGDEALEVGMFAPDALPPLPFPHDDAVVDAWRSGAGAATSAAPGTDLR
ncbi:MAG: NUDIX hydrolase [Chloroflexi bacterium]|nr:NUDIX hydrolase [Chloroflexota bacterium]MDA1239490.1 NUDIX hydrolase [Chloroflexota bacterium]